MELGGEMVRRKPKLVKVDLSYYTFEGRKDNTYMHTSSR
jgi:hypothetical protein